MFRTFALACLVALIVFSPIVAQEVPDVIRTKSKATPEILALFDESFQSLAQAEPNPRAGGLFQLLGVTVRLDNHGSAKKVIDALTVLAPMVEPEELRKQLYEGIAPALCDQEEYAEAVGILQQIAKSTDRYNCQLNLAIKIIFGHEQDKEKTLKPFDASDLIRQAIGGAVEAKDPIFEALARAILGRELARQGKAEESAAVFVEALKIAQRLEEIRDQAQVAQFVLQSQVLYGQIEGAQATSQVVVDPQIKQVLTGTLFQALLQNEKYVEAEKLVKTFPANEEGRDAFIQEWVIANVKSVTDEKIGELSALISEPHRERSLQSFILHLQKNNRHEVAVQVSKQLKNPADAGLVFLIGQVELLIEAKRLTEAVQFIDQSNEDVAYRQELKRQVLTRQFEETREEAIVQQIAETYTSEEKVALTELREEAAQAAEIPDATERMNILFEVLQEQFQIMDIAGVRQTLKLISEQVDKVSDPVQIIQHRLQLAQFQVELRDNMGTKANLGKLMQTLDVKDVNVFKDLVSDLSNSEPPATTNGRIKVNLPGVSEEAAVNESAIRDQLFQVYVAITDLLAKADVPTESKSAFEKAKAQANLEPDALQKAAKLTVLMRLLAENEKTFGTERL